jgi:hypothetical protein
MAIKTKGSSVSGRTPLPADLLERQLAVNTADGYLFTKHSDGTIKDIKVKVADLATNATNAVNATTAVTCTGNAGTVTNGVYTIGNQTIAGVKTFSSSPIIPIGDSAGEAVNFDQFANSFGTSGWQKLPSGLIIQWGTQSTSITVVIFPIAFPNACVHVNWVHENTGFGNQPRVTGRTKTGFNLSGDCCCSCAGAQPAAWFAIGY